jgi:hypothetical protein
MQPARTPAGTHTIPTVRSTARATPLASAPSPASTTTLLASAPSRASTPTPATGRSAYAPSPAGTATPAAPARRALTASAAAAAIVLAALAGCGSSSPSGTSASPATVVPGSAALYLDAAVQPEGALKADANTAGRTLTGRPKPFEGLLKLLAGPTGKTPSYAREVKPWLGPHAGIFLTAIDLSHAQGLLGASLLQKILSEGLPGEEAALLGEGGLQSAIGSSSAQGALVLDTTNLDAARSFLEAQAHSAGGHTTSYRGVTYRVSPDGVAEGIVHRFAVIGSEAGMKSVIETAAGGPSLARAPGYAKLASTAQAGTGPHSSSEPTALANVYLNPEELSHALTGSGSSESILPLLESLLGKPAQLYLSVIPSASSVTLDLDTLESSTAHPSGSGAGSTSLLDASGAQVLRGLPSSAWLAIGIGDLGDSFANDTQGLRALASLGSTVNIGGLFSLAKLFAPLDSHTIDVQRDLLSWMGATGLYTSGTSVLSLQGALVITSKDPARSRAALGKIAQAYREVGGQSTPTSIPGTEAAMTIKLPGFPLALTMAVGQGKFVAGLGASSVQEALSPQSTLAGTPAYNAAASALGQGIQPSALIEFHTLSGLIESLGLSQSPSLSGLASGVAPLGALSAGGWESLSNGVKRARVVIALQ